MNKGRKEHEHNKVADRMFKKYILEYTNQTQTKKKEENHAEENRSKLNHIHINIENNITHGKLFSWWGK